MENGFSPRYQEELPLNQLTSEQFLTLAIEAVKQLEWNLGQIWEHGFSAHTEVSESSSGEEVSIQLEANKAILTSISATDQQTDSGRNKQNIADFIRVFNQLQSTITLEELQQKVESFRQLLHAQTERMPVQPPATAKDNFSDFLSIFKPTADYVITPVLINLNIIIFLLMAFSGVNIMTPDNDSLLLWGANFKVLTLGGEWWRIITSCFIHIGILHLFMNMYGLLYIGGLLEPFLGKVRFTSAYLLSGITGSMTTLYWHDLTISAGASGAIFGMYGVFLAMLTTNLLEPAARKSMLSSTLFFIGFNLVFGLQDGIDNAAHIGGLLGGLLIGYVYFPSLKNRDEPKLKYLTVGMLTTVILLGSFVLYQHIPNNLAEYDKKMEQFMSMESMALEVYNLPETTPKEELLREIKDRGIYYWKENINLLEELKKLDLPEQLQERSEKLKKYCELRIKSYELLYKQVNENSRKYAQQIESYDKQIQLVVNELTGKNEEKE